MGTVHPMCPKCVLLSRTICVVGKTSYRDKYISFKGKIYKCLRCNNVFITFVYKRNTCWISKIEQTGVICKEIDKSTVPINRLKFDWDTLEITVDRERFNVPKRSYHYHNS